MVAHWGIIGAILYFEQDLTNRHLIAAGHKKDLTNSFAYCIIGAGYTKCFIVALLLAPARQKIDYDFILQIGHKFSAKM